MMGRETDQTSELERLAELFKAGLLTQDEFADQKGRVLQSQRPGVTHSSPGAATQVGSYAIIEHVADGGFGSVYRGRHASPAKAAQQGGDVALKIMHAHLARNLALVGRFDREADMCLKLDHPNIVRVFDVVRDGSQHGIVMEWLEGDTLAQRLAGGAQSWADVATWLTGVMSAVEYAHREHLVHRDIKPDNVVLTPRGVKVLDFGIAKDVRSTRTMTGTGMGTLDYAAPEQWTDASKVDERADVYALGMTVYQALRGSLPWEPATPEFDVMRMKHEGRIPPLRQVLAGVDPRRSDAIAVALSPDPERRFRTVQAFAVALGLRAPITKDDVELDAVDLEDEEPTNLFGGGVGRSLGAPKAMPDGSSTSEIAALSPAREEPHAATSGGGSGGRWVLLGVVALLGSVALAWMAQEDAETRRRDEAQAALDEANQRYSEDLVAQALALLRTHKTNEKANKDQSYLARAGALVDAALTHWETPEAKGLQALTQAWSHKWQWSNAKWNEANFVADDQLTREALRVGQTPTALLARALVAGTACLHLSKPDPARAQAYCAEADGMYLKSQEGFVGDPRAWLGFEALWLGVMYENSRAVATEGASSRDHSHRAAEMCTKGWSSMSVAPVNDVELAQECLETAGMLGNHERWMTWGGWLAKRMDSRASSLRKATSWHLFTTAHPECRALKLKWYSSDRVWAPDVHGGRNREAELYCAAAGLYVLNCGTAADSQYSKAQNLTSMALPWAAMRAAHSSTYASRVRPSCPLRSQ